MKKQYKYALIISATCLFLLGWWILSILPQLLVGASFGPRFYPSTGETEDRVIVSDVDPQVIYRVDQHRYLTLENYISCDQGGSVYYNDDKLGIKKWLSGGNSANYRNSRNHYLGYRGIIINAAANGDIGFPDAPTDFCNDHGCPAGISISTDRGKTFSYIMYDRTPNAPDESRKITIAVSDDVFYMNTLFPRDTSIVTLRNKLDYEKSIRHFPEYAPLPTGDTHYYCDNRIKPRSVKYLKKDKNKEH